MIQPMKNGLPYYKAYPRDFIEGTIGMPFEIKCAYRVILDMIYMQGGKLPDDARYISGLLGCSIRKWKSIRESLVDAGKLNVSGEFLTNNRADKELETLSKLQDNQREKASLPRKNKGLQQPRQSQPEPEPDIREESTNVLLASAPQTIDEIAQAVSAYNATATRVGWPKVAVLSTARRASLRSRMREAGGPDGWVAALDRAEASPFLRGERGDFRCTFDFLSKQSNFTKLMEGNYDDRANGNPASGRSNQSRAGGAHHNLMAGFGDVAYRNS